MEIFILVLSGIVGGFIAGLLGLGGGIFYILILPLAMSWYGVSEDSSSAFIIANSLFGIAFASASSLISDFKKFKIYWKESFFLAIPAVILSLLTIKFIVQSSWYSIKIFNAFVILLMIFILIQMQIKRKAASDDKKLSFLQGAMGGGSSGIISALSGLGGGIIIIPLLQIGFKQSQRKAKIISLVVIFLSSGFMTLQNLFSDVYPIENLQYQWGYIIPNIAIPLTIGVFIGSPFGVRLSTQLQDKYLNLFFSLIVLFVLIEKLFLYF
jgi:uncharacterized membrane protein YfcA